ncbi:hypothetical protein D4765_07245 [Subtercola vilae]|uniref:CBM-cenC domain-containing protein n=1 Tax=Subtercola vilae TaxID=2056433 RepID=A0A4T2C1L0_9MICO|nr:hypothetical protein D4765_07245 [Subtercola vilae]
MTVALLAVVGLSAVEAVSAPAAQALSGSSFDAGNIVSDAVFFNGTTMGVDSVQAFLASHGSNCSTSGGSPCLKDFSQATATRAATSYCLTYNGLASESAAQIIVKVAQACSINPQVLLVMLQKEQGLIDASSTSSYMYRSALGYGCPDTAACDSTYYGFFNQVYSAASQFQSYTKNSSSWSYQPGRVNNILYNPNTSCGSAPVYIQNQATANLYIYTPYQPNAAALANLSGSGDGCSAYGNRNFWVYFNNWFGSPTGGGLLSPSFEGGAVGWAPGNGFVNRVTYNDASIAEDGSWFYASNTPVAGRSIAQDVQYPLTVGNQVTASIWLRSSTSQSFSGRVALWGIGGSTEVTSQSFAVTGSWQQFTLRLPARASAHSSVRLEVYMDQTAGTLYLDNAAMSFGQAPPVKNLISAPGFEGALGDWGPGNGFVNRTAYQDASIAHSGNWFGAANTDVAGRSIAQLLSASPNVGDRYTFSIWVKSSNPAKPFSGHLALWGLGGAQSINSGLDFTTTAVWTRVTATLDITVGGMSALKPEVYMQSTGNTIYLDDGLLSKNLLTAGSFENGSFANWNSGKGTINQAVYSSTATGLPAQDGEYFAATNTTVAGNSLAQTLPRVTMTGDTYTADVWLRSSDLAGTFSGTLALWALGGSVEVGAKDFTVGGGWTQVTVDLPIANEDHTELRFEIYQKTTGNTLFVDGAQVY